jgi:hypothetical protein
VKTARLGLLAVLVLITAVAAYMARDLVREFVVLPLAYVLWQLRGLLDGVAQLVQWGILVSLLALVMAWQLVPRLAPPRRSLAGGPARGGPVKATAASLARARTSNYFRWQLANRLGRVARHLGQVPRTDPDASASTFRVNEYLDAGLNHSFVDYAARRVPFAARAVSPLDLDPEEAVRHLETHLTQSGGSDGDSR